MQKTFEGYLCLIGLQLMLLFPFNSDYRNAQGVSEITAQIEEERKVLDRQIKIEVLLSLYHQILVDFH